MSTSTNDTVPRTFKFLNIIITFISIFDAFVIKFFPSQLQNQKLANRS